MRYIDYHIHSSCSSDGHFTMLQMALASYEKGVRDICFTDHCDLDYHFTGLLKEEEPYAHRQQVLNMYRELQEKKPADLNVNLGMELGSGSHAPETAARIAASPELDFVMGSLHNLRGIKDFYEFTYEDPEECRKLNEMYAKELVELSKLNFYDVMAHIGYTIRYMRRDGLDISFSMDELGDIIDTCLKNLIEGGRGIEINCSGFRSKRMREPIPSVDVLKRYKELGGEIITIGTDAHRTNQAAGGLEEGFDILRELGYKYVTVFRQRRPEFLPID